MNKYILILSFLMYQSVFAYSSEESSQKIDYCVNSMQIAKGQYDLGVFFPKGNVAAFNRHIDLLNQNKSIDTLIFNIEDYELTKILIKYKNKSNQVKDSELYKAPIYIYNGVDRKIVLALLSYPDKKSVSFQLLDKDLAAFLKKDFLRFSIDGSANEYYIFENFNGFSKLKSLVYLPKTNEAMLQNFVKNCETIKS